MAQDSRHARKVRRLKRKISQSARFTAQTNRQQRQRLEERLVHTQFALLAVLMEHGDSTGGVAVAKETAALVMTDFAHLVWKVDTQEDGTLRVVFSDRRTEPQTVTEVPSNAVVPAPRSVAAQLADADLVDVATADQTVNVV